MPTTIKEQAYQVPLNSAPVGWDPTEVIYPSISSCLTVTLCFEKMLVGCHMGMIMGTADPKGKGARPIKANEMRDYLKAIEKNMKTLGSLGTPWGVILAGMLGYWTPPQPNLQPVKDQCLQWSKKLKATYHERDTTKYSVVDIHVKNTSDVTKATEVKKKS